jgi:ribosomal protein S14
MTTHPLSLCTLEFLRELHEELSSKLAEVSDEIQKRRDCARSGHNFGVWHSDRTGDFRVCRICGHKEYLP